MLLYSAWKFKPTEVKKTWQTKTIRVKDSSTVVHSRKRFLALNSNFRISIVKQLVSVRRNSTTIAASVLIYSHKLVLKPYVSALQNNTGDENLVRIQHLERLMEQNTEQRETLTKLMAQGYIDQVLYNSEMNALLAQANTYRDDIEIINSTMSGDSSRGFEAERLLHFAERGSMLQEYSEELFERFVDHIQVYFRQEVGFVMKCGLTFKEAI